MVFCRRPVENHGFVGHGSWSQSSFKSFKSGYLKSESGESCCGAPHPRARGFGQEVGSHELAPEPPWHQLELGSGGLAVKPLPRRILVLQNIESASFTVHRGWFQRMSTPRGRRHQTGRSRTNPPLARRAAPVPRVPRNTPCRYPLWRPPRQVSGNQPCSESGDVQATCMNAECSSHFDAKLPRATSVIGSSPRLNPKP